MKLGKDFPKEWKDKSEKDNIPLSDLLYGYAVEDLLVRIGKSTFRDYLWLTNEDALGESAYKKKVKTSLDYIYVETAKKNLSEKIVAGQAFGSEVVTLFLNQLFLEEDVTMHWECERKEIVNGVHLLFTCTYMGLKVPVSVRIHTAHISSQRPKEKDRKCLFEEKKKYTYLSYSKEGVLAESLFEIMRKLELISNMEMYDVVNEIIKTQPVSGRHILEDFKNLGEKEPKVVAMKRLEQLASYKEYAYMKKKWQQYARNHRENADNWEDVMERILQFIGPLWKALCENEIFFDDWMPELGRFLG